MERGVPQATVYRDPGGLGGAWVGGRHGGRQFAGRRAIRYVAIAVDVCTAALYEVSMACEDVRSSGLVQADASHAKRSASNRPPVQSQRAVFFHFFG